MVCLKVQVYLSVCLYEIYIYIYISYKLWCVHTIVYGRKEKNVRKHRGLGVTGAENG